MIELIITGFSMLWKGFFTTLFPQIAYIKQYNLELSIEEWIFVILGSSLLSVFILLSGNPRDSVAEDDADVNNNKINQGE